MSRGRRQGKRAREMDYLLEQYVAAHPEEEGGPIEPYRIAPWAIERGLWKRPPVTPEDILRRELAQHLAHQYITDPQDREVRRNHAIFVEIKTADGVKQRSRWYAIFQAPPDHMKQSLQLRRRAAVQDILQLDLDFHSYNDNNVFSAKLPPMDYDLNKDVAEAKLPTIYPSEAPSELEDKEEDG